jgi:alpha-L-arabinofuranosidase
MRKNILKSSFLIIYILCTSKGFGQADMSIRVEADQILSETATLNVLQSNDLSALNSLAEPEHISPVETEIKVQQKNFTVILEPYLGNVIKLTQN